MLTVTRLGGWLVASRMVLGNHHHMSTKKQLWCAHTPCVVDLCHVANGIYCTHLINIVEYIWTTVLHFTVQERERLRTDATCQQNEPQYMNFESNNCLRVDLKW